MEVLLIWGQFVILLILVLIFGNRAARSADIIAEKKNLGKAFMGLVFISMVTSFPELFTGISAGAVVEAPDIAVGQIMGSCVFNMLILGVVEVFFRKKHLYQLTGKANILPLGFSLIIITLVTFFISTRFGWKLWHIGLSTIIIFAVYLLFMYVIFKERRAENNEGDEKYKDKKLSTEIVMFAISTSIIIAVG